MKSKDTRLSQEVEKRFFMFEAIPMVPDEAVPQAVRTLPSSVVVQALQGSAQDIQRKVIMAFPEQARTGLVTALRASRADPEAVQDARRQVVAKFQELGRQGRIDLKQISDAWQGRAKAS
jgi:flagellar motor switch protein FliG